MNGRAASIREAALGLLLMQNPVGRFALLSLEYTALVTSEPVICCDLSEISEPGNGVLGASTTRGGIGVVYIDTDAVRRLEPDAVRAVLHEYGHIILRHGGGRNDRASENEADEFALEFLVPEFFVRYLALGAGLPDEKYLSGFLPAPADMIKKRLGRIRKNGRYIPCRTELELMKRFFSPDDPDKQ